MDIGGSAAVPGQFDIGVAHEVVFFIDHWGLPPHQDKGIAVVQQPHFVRGEQLPARLLEVLGVGAVAPPALAGGAGLDGLLAQQFGHILVGALLVAAQVDKGVGVADDALPRVLEKFFQLGDVLQNDSSHDIS